MSFFDRWRSDRPHPHGSPSQTGGRAVVSVATAEDPAEWYRRLVELSPDGIVLHQDGEVVYANHAALTMAGIPEQLSIIGASIYELLELDVQERPQLAADGGTPERPGTDQFTLHRRDGTTIPVEVTSASVSHEGRPATQSMLRDISAFVERERWLNMQSRTSEVMADINARLLGVENRDDLFEVAAYASCTLFEANGTVLLRHTADGRYLHFHGDSLPLEATQVLAEVAARDVPTLDSPVATVPSLEEAGLTEGQRVTLAASGVQSFMIAPTRMVSAEYGVTVLTFAEPDHAGLANVDGFRLVLNALYVAAQRISSLEELRRNEERFRDAVEANPAGFAILSPVLDAEGTMVDAEYVFVNTAMQEMLSRTCGDPNVKLYSHAYASPARFTAGMERFRTALRRGEPAESISRDDYPNGPERWVRRRILPTAHGNLTLTVRDITAEIRAQQAVEDAEERFKAAAESNPGAFLILQPVRDGNDQVEDYTVDFANQAAREAFLQHAPDEDIRLKDVVGRDAVAETATALGSVLSTGQPLDEAVRLPQPARADIAWYRRRIAVQGGRLFVTYEDISDERKSDAEARRNFNLLRAAADSNRDTFLLMEPLRDASGTIVNFRVLFQNRRALETRVPSNDPNPATLKDVLYYDEAHFERVLHEYIEAFEAGEPTIKELAWEYNGTTSWFERHLSTTGDVLTVVYRDITQFRNEIADLGAAEADRRAVLEGLADAIVVADRDSEGRFRVTYANTAFREMFGDPGHGLMSEVAAAFDEPARALIASTREDAVGSRSTRSFDYDGMIGGVQRALSIAITPVFDSASGEVIRTIWRATDLTVQREAAQRLAAAAEANPDAFLIMDPVRNDEGDIIDFEITFENAGARAIRRAFGGKNISAC